MAYGGIFLCIYVMFIFKGKRRNRFIHHLPLLSPRSPPNLISPPHPRNPSLSSPPSLSAGLDGARDGADDAGGAQGAGCARAARSSTRGCCGRPGRSWTAAAVGQGRPGRGDLATAPGDARRRIQAARAGTAAWPTTMGCEWISFSTLQIKNCS